MEIKAMDGKLAAKRADALFGNLPARAREQMLWDAPQERKLYYLRENFRRASLVALRYRGARPDGAAWIVPFAQGGRSGQVHIAMPMADKADALATGKRLMEIAAKDYDALVCTVPAPYIGVRMFVEAMGFAKAIRLPKGCLLAWKAKLVDGFVYAWSKQDG